MTAIDLHVHLVHLAVRGGLALFLVWLLAMFLTAGARLR